MKLVNNLPSPVEVQLGGEVVTIPEATETHNEYGSLVAVPGEVDLTEVQARFVKDGKLEQLTQEMFEDGAIELVEPTVEEPTVEPAATQPAAEEKSGVFPDAG